MITLTLPYPVSANAYWRSFVPRGASRPVVTLSEAAIAYKERVAWLARAAGFRSPIKGRVVLHVQLYPQRPQDWQKRMRDGGASWDDSVRCIDLDNANKVLFDALKGVAFEDDSWIRRLVSERMEPDADPARVMVRVAPIALEAPQESLF